MGRFNLQEHRGSTPHRYDKTYIPPPAPCVTCHWAAKCAEEKRACRDFYNYVEGRKNRRIATEKSRFPTQRLYNVIFQSEDDYRVLSTKRRGEDNRAEIPLEHTPCIYPEPHTLPTLADSEIVVHDLSFGGSEPSHGQ